MKKSILIILGVIIVIAVAVVVFVFQVPAGGGPVASENVNEITIQDLAFSPAIINIKKGTKVTWTNLDSVSHQIKSDPHPGHTDLPRLSSDPLNYSQAYSYTFDKAGKFGYHCEIHPNMQGWVIVE